jgi:signal transduction histidine kinase/ligand-binding sensor domain-containing protein
MDSQAQLYYKAKNLTADHGLSDNRVTCFYKDRNGFMWIGTRNGLNRYDGHSFKIFRPAAGNSISNEVINDIAEDKAGRLWVATMEGLNCYDPGTRQWSVIIPDPDESAKGLPNFIVWDIWFDKKGLLWIASDVFAFSSYDIQKKIFTYYDWPAFAKSQINSLVSGKYNSIQKFVAKNDHEFWLGTTKGLVRLDIRTKEFSFTGGGYYSDVTGLAYDAASKKVFLTAEQGEIFVFDEQAGNYRQETAVPEPYPSTHFSLPGDNELWIASVKGLIKISDDRKKINLMVNIPQLSGSLLPGGVRSVFVDNDRIRWVGTVNGVSIYDPAGRSASFLPLLGISDKDAWNRMGGVFFDEVSKSYFVCAINPAAVFIINSTTGVIKKITTDARGAALSPCLTIKQDLRKDLWLLTEENVYRYDRLTGQFVVFLTPRGSKLPTFRDMVQDAEGNYWFATFNSGIFYYNSKEKAFFQLEDSNRKYLVSVSALASDTVHKKVFIGTFGMNLYIYDLPTRKLSAFYDTKTTRKYAHLNLVNDITEDAAGVTWVATHSGGVFRYEHGMSYEKTFTHFDMRTGLKNNNIISLCSDGDTTMWLLSGSGLSAISTTGNFLYSPGREQLFNFSSYSSDLRLHHPVFYNKEKRELLTGVGGGLLLYMPVAADTLLRFPVVVTGMKTDVGELDVTTSGYRIPFRNKSFSFEFAGLYYGTAAGISYQYRLEGYDREWMDTKGQYSVTYQNLPAGNYLFRVRATDNKGFVKGEASGFAFTIKTPFWQSWWFIVLSVLLSAATIYRIIYSLRQKLKAEKLLNSFATSLYGQNTIDDIFWDTARNCIEKLEFTDCVIYQKDETRGVLVQRAAFGPKNPNRREIINQIEIAVGKGIVGTVAKTGKAEIIRNTSRDSRYIVDDHQRLSEISIPVMVDGKVFAIIDSEHPEKKFFTRYHLRLLQKIAAVCSERISKYLSEDRLRTKIARDLHDEMGSTLTSINITSKVAMQEGMEEEKVKYYLQKIKDNSGKMMESMSDIVWAINPSNDSFEKLVIKMKEFAAELLEPARINYYFREEGALDKAQLNLEQRKDFYMIFKEAVNNAVKYSRATEVNIDLLKRDNRLRMIITDNGDGFDLATSFSGNGLRNMQARAEEMGAEVKIDSIRGVGTTVALEIIIT